MATMSTAIPTANINLAIRECYDPSKPDTLAAMGTMALHRLQNQLPAAGVATVDVDTVPPHGFKFTVTSTAVLDADDVKRALR